MPACLPTYLPNPRLFSCKAAKGVPALYVTKEWELYMEGPLEASGPVELFGFNTGDINTTEAVDKDAAIPFTISSDAANVVVVTEDPKNGNVKQYMAFCDAAFAALHEHHIPDVALQFHQLASLQHEGKDVLFRYQVNMFEQVVFCPNKLSDAQLQGQLLKRACFGAAFLDKFTKLPVTDARVTWEISLTKEPPARFQPMKPKVWLTGPVSLQADAFYRLQ
jgi:hypothetical protein